MRYLIIILLLSSCATSKHKATDKTRTDSTVISHTDTRSISRADSIGVREIKFTANKITEIDYYRDTLYKDSIVYRTKIKIIEQVQNDTKEATRLSKSDSETVKADSHIQTKNVIKKTEKQKLTKPLSLAGLALIALLAIFLLYCLNKLRKYTTI